MNVFVEIREGIGISWDALLVNKMRSVLATFGIVIGIVTVTLTGAAINGLNQAFIKSTSTLGADVFFVSQFSWFDPIFSEGWMKSMQRRPIRLRDAEVLAHRLALAAVVAPEAEYGQGTLKYKTRSASGVDIIGTTGAFSQTCGVGMAQGRFLTAADAEGERPVCVIGSDIVTNLFRNESPIGA